MVKTDLLPYEADKGELVKVVVSFRKEEWNPNTYMFFRKYVHVFRKKVNVKNCV